MSEIAKCPVCGETLSGHVDGVVECKGGCSFRCGGYALSRIAAAMELAKRLKELSQCDINTQHAHVEKQFEVAERRVFEVF